jgi:hypothetical protein
VGEGRRRGAAAAVVVSNIFREHYTQVPLVEDQLPVGEFGSDRTHEPFGKTIRPRTTRRNPHRADARRVHTKPVRRWRRESVSYAESILGGDRGGVRTSWPFSPPELGRREIRLRRYDVAGSCFVGRERIAELHAELAGLDSLPTAGAGPAGGCPEL